MSTDFKASEKQVVKVLEKHTSQDRLDEANEADTRCEVIDNILRALGWETEGVKREVNTGVGEWIDYTLDAQGNPWLVIEAKRSGRTFFIDSHKGKPHNASVATLLKRGGSSIKEAMRQAAGYCNDVSAPFACVTTLLERMRVAYPCHVD
jgi:hypothetical protein